MPRSRKLHLEKVRASLDKTCPFVMASAPVAGRSIANVEGGMLASIAFAGAIIAGMRGARYASLDTHEKVLRMIESLDKDIARLKDKLSQ
jgi:hypothetical protein